MTALDARVRRFAHRHGYYVHKSRFRRDTPDNRGGYMLLEDGTNTVVMGDRFQMTAEDVFAYCRAHPTPWSKVGKAKNRT